MIALVGQLSQGLPPERGGLTGNGYFQLHNGFSFFRVRTRSHEVIVII